MEKVRRQPIASSPLDSQVIPAEADGIASATRAPLMVETASNRHGVARRHFLPASGRRASLNSTVPELPGCGIGPIEKPFLSLIRRWINHNGLSF
jgi:hypothetical protein